jgi:hypothetical protein
MVMAAAGDGLPPGGISRADMAEQVTTQTTELQNEIRKLRAEMRAEMKHTRKEFCQGGGGGGTSRGHGGPVAGEGNYGDIFGDE